MLMNGIGIPNTNTTHVCVNSWLDLLSQGRKYILRFTTVRAGSNLILIIYIHDFFSYSNTC